MATSKKTTGTNEIAIRRVVITMKTVAYGLFALGLYVSVGHLFDFFHHTLSASFVTAAAMPFFVDGFQIVGRLLRLDYFAKSTKRTGWWLQGLGAFASLAANAIAGQTTGEKVGGIIAVLGYITIEAVADTIKPATDDQDAEEQAKKAAAIAKGQATRAANKAKAAPKPRKTQTPEQRARAAEARKVRQLARQIDAPLTTDARAYI